MYNNYTLVFDVYQWGLTINLTINLILLNELHYISVEMGVFETFPKKIRQQWLYGQFNIHFYDTINRYTSIIYICLAI